MSATKENFSCAEARQAAVRRSLQLANLAERDGNPSLARTLRHKASVTGNATNSTIVELPHAQSLYELWDRLGFTYSEDASHRRYVINGIYRRFAAAMKSIESRGFDGSEIQIGAVEGFWHPFRWESERGRWGSRHWVVTGWLKSGAGKLTAKNVTVSVKSSAAAEEGRTEWTIFRGGPLNSVIAERLAWVLGVLAVRLLERKLISSPHFAASQLTEEERGEYHDLHPSPSSAWVHASVRVVLEDDCDGRGFLRFEKGGSSEAQERLKGILIALVLADREDTPSLELPWSDE